MTSQFGSQQSSRNRSSRALWLLSIVQRIRQAFPNPSVQFERLRSGNIETNVTLIDLNQGILFECVPGKMNMSVLLGGPRNSKVYEIGIFSSVYAQS